MSEHKTEYLLSFRGEEGTYDWDMASFDRAELDAMYAECVHYGADPENFTMSHRRVTVTSWVLTTKPVIH